VSHVVIISIDVIQTGETFDLCFIFMTWGQNMWSNF